MCKEYMYHPFITQLQSALRPVISPSLLVCYAFIIISGVAYTFAELIREEFIVIPRQHEQHHIITDEVLGSAAIIYDIDQGRVIAGKNEIIPTSMASITKLTAALLAYPRLDDSDVTVIDSDDFALAPNTQLRLGDEWRTTDLLEYSLITSSNRGMNAVGRTIEKKTGISLVDLMNAFVREYGLVQTHFVNPTGLDAHDTLAGSESSALDLARIASIIVTTQPELALQTVIKSGVFYSRDSVRYEAENTNELIGDLPDILLLSKTGYTDIAGGALTMAIERNGRRIAFVVLGSTRDGRFDDMKALMQFYGELTGEVSPADAAEANEGDTETNEGDTATETGSDAVEDTEPFVIE